MNKKEQIRSNLTPSHHAMLFAYIAKSATDTLGSVSLPTLQNGVKRYGKQRGSRMAQRTLKDSRKLDVKNYFIYGEWIPATGEMEIEYPTLSPDTNMVAKKCSWQSAWANESMLEYGAIYCDFIDEAIAEGYSPEVRFELKSHRTNGHHICDFRFIGANLTLDDMEEIRDMQNKLGTSIKKHWDYHIGHIYKTMKEELIKDFGLKGEKAVDLALEMYKEKYGQEAYDIVLQYRDVNFDIVDDYF